MEIAVIAVCFSIFVMFITASDGYGDTSPFPIPMIIPLMLSIAYLAS